LVNIIPYCGDFMEVKERRRSGFSFIFAWDGVEDHGKALACFREDGGPNKGVDDSGIATRLQISSIKLIVRETKNGRMRPEVLRQFNDAVGRVNNNNKK
jgi:hypothetical protein